MFDAVAGVGGEGTTEVGLARAAGFITGPAEPRTGAGTLPLPVPAEMYDGIPGAVGV